MDVAWCLYPQKGWNFCLFGKCRVRLKDNGSRGDESARLCTIDVRSWCTTWTSSSFPAVSSASAFSNFSICFRYSPNIFWVARKVVLRAWVPLALAVLLAASMPHKIFISPAAVVLVQACSNNISTPGANMSLNPFRYQTPNYLTTQVSTQRVDLIYPVRFSLRSNPDIQALNKLEVKHVRDRDELHIDFNQNSFVCYLCLMQLIIVWRLNWVNVIEICTFSDFHAKVISM